MSVISGCWAILLFEAHIVELINIIPFLFKNTSTKLISTTYIPKKMKFSIKDFFSKCHQIHSFLRISSHLLKKSLMENFIFCAVLCTRYFDSLQRCIEDFLSMKLDCWWLVHRLLLSEVLLCLVFFAVQKVYPRVVFFRKI